MEVTASPSAAGNFYLPWRRPVPYRKGAKFKGLHFILAMKNFTLIHPIVVCLSLHLLTTSVHAQVPQIINYQGRVAVGGTNFTGTGQFCFALVDTSGSTTYWSNDGTSTGGGRPANAVSLSVTGGLYSLALGDTTLANMTAIPYGVFGNSDVRLRIWFNDGTHDWQQLAPDQRIASVGYAMVANGVGNGAITSAMIANGTVIPAQSVSGTTQATVANTSYSATSSKLTTFTLPAIANVGNIIQVSGVGAGGWQVTGAINGYWTLTSAPSTGWRAVATSADGTHLAAAANAINPGLIYTSTNSGQTWVLTSATTAGFFASIASSADGTHLAAADSNSELIYTSTNSGGTWTKTSAPQKVWTSIASSADGTHLAAATGQYAGIYISTDSGQTWTQTSASSAYVYLCIASSSDGTHLAAVANGRVSTSADGGQTWTLTSVSGIGTSIASSSDGTHLASACNNGSIYTSTDSGVTWTKTSAPQKNWTSIASSADGTYLAATDGALIYMSADGGVTWMLSNAPRAAWSAIASSSDGAHLVAPTNNGGIYTFTGPVSGTQGSSEQFQYVGNGFWQPLQTNVNWQVNGNNIYYIAGYVGIGTNTPIYPLTMASGAYCSTAGVWTSVSDRNVKEDFTSITPGEVLAKVATLPIAQWKYKVEPDGIKHIGPVAQDFHAAFGLGDNERAIGSVDETGVALAAIQGLNQKLEEQKEQNAKLEAENAAFKKELISQAARLSRLEQAAAASPTPVSHGNPEPKNGQPASADGVPQ